MQTVRAFCSDEGMRQFRDWVMHPDDAELLAAVKPQKKRGRQKGKKGKEGEAEADAGESAHCLGCAYVSCSDDIPVFGRVSQDDSCAITSPSMHAIQRTFILVIVNLGLEARSFLCHCGSKPSANRNMEPEAIYILGSICEGLLCR